MNERTVYANRPFCVPNMCRMYAKRVPKVCQPSAKYVPNVNVNANDNVNVNCVREAAHSLPHTHPKTHALHIDDEYSPQKLYF